MQKLIAVLDDDSDMGELYSFMLEALIKNELISLKIFNDPRIFLDWLEYNSPDLIISDISLPYISGPEVIKKITSSNRKIPTILVSGHEASEYSSIMAELGISHFFSKPLDYCQLIRFIEKELGVVNSLA